MLDGIDLLRGAFVRMDDYSLDAVAREVLGEGKAVAGDARDRIAEIIHNYQHDSRRTSRSMPARMRASPSASSRSCASSSSPLHAASSRA